MNSGIACVIHIPLTSPDNGGSEFLHECVYLQVKYFIIDGTYPAAGPDPNEKELQTRKSRMAKA